MRFKLKKQSESSSFFPGNLTIHLQMKHFDSLLLQSPLNEGLVLTAEGAHSLHGRAVDLNVSNVLGVPTITFGFVIFSARVPINVHKAVIISGCDDSSVLAHFNDIDMATIRTWWIDPVDTPAKLDRMGCPRSGNCS